MSLWPLILVAACSISCSNDLILPEVPKPTTKIINIPYILKVMDTINYSKKFESYILLVTNLLDAWDEDDISSFRQKMFQTDMQPHILIYNSHFDDETAHLHISNILNLNSITIVFAKSNNDNVLNAASKMLRNFKMSIVIVVITHPFTMIKSIRTTVSKILNKLSEENMVNSVVVYDNNAFKFELYPIFKTLNMSGQEYLLDLQAHMITDFHGYRIRTPIKNDLPRVFKEPSIDINIKVHGIAG